MELTEADIVRSELCKFITHKFKELVTSNVSKPEENNKEMWKPGNK